MIKSKPLYGEVIGEVVNGSVVFTDHFMRFLDELVDQKGLIPWNNLTFTGSNLEDIEIRWHNDLQEIGGADDTDTDTSKVQHVSNLQAKMWTDAIGNLATHAANTGAHGVTGSNVGTGDLATLLIAGVVRLAAAVADAAATTVSVDSDSINSAPPSYDQDWAADVQTLVNECKDGINQLASDVNDIKDQLNALMAALRSSGALDT